MQNCKLQELAEAVAAHVVQMMIWRPAEFSEIRVQVWPHHIPGWPDW